MNADLAEIDCKFTGRIEELRGTYVVEIPDQEVEFGTLAEGDVCRVSIRKLAEEPNHDDGQVSSSRHPTPPVSVGERRTVEIEDMGDQGDGIARIDRGYVLIVPETEVGEEVTVEIEQTEPNYGFGTVIETEAESTEEWD